MEILEIIPIYTTPFWFIAILIIASVTLLITIIGGTSEKAGIIAVICALILVIGIILCFCGIPKVYDHDEYIIKFNENTSATEFFKNYEITKTFEYSDAWQVKKKDGVK